MERRVLALLDPRRNRQGLSPRRAVLAAVAAAGLAVPLAAIGAQVPAPRGALAGSVYDASGAVVPQATVTVTGADGNSKEITRSDDAGEYAFPALPTGAYTIEVGQKGFRMFRKAGIAINTGQRTRLNVTLEIGAVSEALEVVGKRSPAPLKPGITPRRIRVGGNVQATKLVYQAKPVYPEEAQQRGVEGTVLLRAVIWKDGSLGSVGGMNKLVDPGLAKAALDAVREWRYEPTLLNGEPVEVVTTITVNFRLAQ